MFKNLQQYVEIYNRESINFFIIEREFRDFCDYKRKVYNIGIYRVIVYIRSCEKNTVIVIYIFKNLCYTNAVISKNIKLRQRLIS